MATRTEQPGRRGFGAELRDAVTARSGVLVLAVLAIQLGFIGSYVGAFHDPTPHDIPVAVTVADGVPVAQRPAAQAAVDRAVGELDGLAGSPVHSRSGTSVADARDSLADRDIDGVLVLNPAGSRDQLLVAGAGSAAVAEALTTIVDRAEAAQQRQVTVTDVIPAGSGDARGLSSFYLAVGWVVGGYLVAALLGVSSGSRPANRRRATIRLGALAVYAVASGVLGALLIDALVPAFDGHLLPLAALGALVVFASGAVTMGLQALLGVAGIGLVIILFVVLGNPSAGGPYPGVLLPAFWRVIGPWLAPGAATTGIRGIAYFGGSGVGTALLVLAAYAVVGAGLALLASRARPAPGHHLAPGAVAVAE